MGTKHFSGELRGLLRRDWRRLRHLPTQRRRGIVLLAVLVFVALLLPLITLVLTSINTEAVSTAEAIKGAKSELAAQKALNDAISLVVQEKSYPDFTVSASQPNTAIIVVDALTGMRRDQLPDSGGGNIGAGLDGVYGTADDYWIGPRHDGSHIGLEDDEASVRSYSYDYTFKSMHAPTYLGQSWSFSNKNKPYAYSEFTGDPIWQFTQYAAEDGLTPTDDLSDDTPDGFLAGVLNPFVNDEPVLSGPGYYSGADEPRVAGPGSAVVRDLTDGNIEQYMYNAKVNIYESIFTDLDRGPIPSSLLKSYANVTDEAGRLNLNIFCKKVRVWAPEDQGTDYDLAGYGTVDFNDNTQLGEAGWKWIDNPLFPDRSTVALRDFDTTNGTFTNSTGGGSFGDGVVDFGSFNAATGVPLATTDGIGMPELGESVQHFYRGAPGGAGSDPYAAGNTPYSVQAMYNSLRMLMALPGMDPQLAANLLTYLNPSLDALDDDFDPVRSGGWPPDPDPENGFFRQDAMNLTPPLTALNITVTGGTVNNFNWDFEANDYDDLPLPTPRQLTSLEQLRDIPGMTEAKFNRLKDQVTVFSYDTNVIGTGVSDIAANADLVDPYVPGDPLYRGQTLGTTPASLRDTDDVADLRMDVGRVTTGRTLSDYQQEADRMYAWLRTHLSLPYYSKITLPVVDRLGRAGIADDRLRNNNPNYALLGGAGLMPHRDTSGATDTTSGIYNVGELGAQFPSGTRPAGGYPALNPEFSVDSCLSILLYRNGTFFQEDDYNYDPDNGAFRPAANRNLFTLFGFNFFVPLISIPENSALADLFTDHNNPFYDQGDNVNPAIEPHGPGAVNYAGFSPTAVYANLANPGQMDSAADLLAVPRYKFANMSLSLMNDPPSTFRSSQPGSQDGLVNSYISFSDVIPVRDYLDFIDPAGPNYDPDRVLYELFFNIGNRPGVFPTGVWPFVPGASGTVVIPLTPRNLRAVVPPFNGGGAQSQQNITIVAFDSYNNKDVLSAEFTNHPQYIANEGGLGAVGTLQRNFNQLEVPRPDNDGPFGGAVDGDGNGRPDNAAAGADWPGARPAFYQAFAYDSNGDPYITSRVEAYRWNGWQGATGGGGQPANPEVRSDEVTQTYLQFNEQATIPFRVDILPVRISGDQFEVRSAYGGAVTTGGSFLLYDWTYGGADANDGTWQVQQPGQTINPQIIRITPDNPTITLRLYDLRTFADAGSGLPYAGPAGNLAANVWSGTAVQLPPSFPSVAVPGLVGGYPVEGVHGGFADDTVNITPIEALANFRPQITNLEPAVFSNEGLVDFRASSGGGDLPISYQLNIYPGTDVVTINDSPTGSVFSGDVSAWLDNPANPSYGQSGSVGPASAPLITINRPPSDNSTVFFNDVDITGLGAGAYWVELRSQYTAPGPTIVTAFCYTALQVDNEANPGGSSSGIPPNMNASINLEQLADGNKGFTATVEIDGGDSGYSYYWQVDRPLYDANNNLTGYQIVDSAAPFVGADALTSSGTAVNASLARAFTGNSPQFSARFHDLDLVNNSSGLGGADGRPDADGVYFLHCYVMDKALAAPTTSDAVLAHDVAQVVINSGGFGGAASVDSLARTPMSVLAAIPPGNGASLIGVNNKTPVGTAATRPTLLNTVFGNAIEPDVAGHGDMIKLRGYNFGPTAVANTVNFAGGAGATATSAPVLLGNDGIRDIYEITVRVPDGSQTGPLSVSRNNVTPVQTSNQLFFQTDFNVVFDLVGNVNPDVQNFLRFDLDFQGDGNVDFSYSTQTDPTDPGAVRGGLQGVQHDYASDGVGNYDATLVVTDLISGRRQVSHQLITVRDLNPSATSNITIVPNATIAAIPGSVGGATLDVTGANLVAAGTRVGDRLLMLNGPAIGATANVNAIPGPQSITLSPLSNGAAYNAALIGSQFSIVRAADIDGQNGMLANIWPDVQLRSETFAQRPGEGTVFRSAVGGAPAGVLRKWVVGSNSGGGNGGGGGTFVTSGNATNFNFTGTNFTGRILQDTGNNFITAGVQAGDFVFNESDGGSFAVVSPGGVAATQLQVRNPNPNPAGQGLTSGAAPGRSRTAANLRIENFAFAAGVWTLTDNEFNFFNGTAPAINPAWRGGLVAGDGDPALVGAGAFFRNESDLTTWRVTNNPLAGTPNQLRVEQVGGFSTPAGVTRAANEGLRSFTAAAPVNLGGAPPTYTITTGTLWAQLAGVVNGGLGATVYNASQGNAQWLVVDVPNNYTPPGTLAGAGQLTLEYVSGGTGSTWNAGDAGLIVLPAQWAINWEAAGTDDQWSALIPQNQWRIGDAYRVETSSGPGTQEGIGASFADATYADVGAPVDFQLNLSFQFDLSGQLNQATRVEVAWDGNFGNATTTNLQNFFIGDTTRLNGTLDGLEVERLKITHSFGVPELLFVPGSPGGAPTRARYRVWAVRSGDPNAQSFGPYDFPVVTVGGDDYDTSLATLNTNKYDNSQWQKVDFEASYSIGTRRYYTSDQLAIPPGLSNYANSLVSYTSYDRPFFTANFEGTTTQRHEAVHGGGPSLNWASDANVDGRYTAVSESPLGANAVNTFQFLLPSGINLMNVPGGATVKGASFPEALPGVGRGDSTGNFTYYNAARAVYNGFSFTADNLPLDERSFSFDSQALFFGTRSGRQTTERLPLAADFYIDPVVGSNSQLVTFQGFVSGGNAQDPIYTYQWTVQRVSGGSGGIAPTILNGNSPSITFDAATFARATFPGDNGAGVYRVTMTVNAGGAFRTCYREFELVNTPLSVNVMASPPSASVGDTVTFFVATDGGSAPYDVTINYGDGSPIDTLNNVGTLASFDHVYRLPSSTVVGGVQTNTPYNVTVNVTDNDAAAAAPATTTVDIAETIPLNVDLLVNPASGVAPFNLTVHYTVGGGRRNAGDGYNVLIQLINADGTVVSTTSRSAANTFGANGQLDTAGSPANDDTPVRFVVPSSGNYIVTALAIDNGGALDTASEDVFASGYLKPLNYGNAAPDVMRDREGRPMHAVRVWTDPFLSTQGNVNTAYQNTQTGTTPNNIGGGRLMEADLQVLGDLFTGDPSSNFRSLGMYATKSPLDQALFGADYAAAGRGAQTGQGNQGVDDFYDTFTQGRVNINTASEDALTAVFLHIRTRRAYVLPDDTSGDLQSRYTGVTAAQAGNYADQLAGNEFVDIDLDPANPGLEQVRYAAFPPGDEYLSAANARSLARDVISYRTAFFDLHKPDAPDADGQFGYVKQNYAGGGNLGQNFRVDHLPVIGPWDGVNPKDYDSLTRDAALLPPGSGNLHNAYDNLAGSYYNFDPAEYMFYSPTDIALIRQPVQIDVQLDANGDGTPDAIFRTSENPGNYAKYLNDVVANRSWSNNRGPFYSGLGNWEASTLVPSSTATLNSSQFSFDARNYFTYNPGQVTVNLNLLTGASGITTTSGEDVTAARNKIGIVNSNGITSYSYIPNPPFRHIADLYKVINDAQSPQSFPLTGNTDATLTLSADGLTTAQRIFSGPSRFRYQELWSDRAGEFIPIANWLDDVAPFLTTRSYVFRVEAAGSVSVSGGSQTAALDSASLQRDRGRMAVLDVGPQGGRNDLYLLTGARGAPGASVPARQNSYRILYSQE